MKNQRLFLSLLFLFWVSISFSQDFQITTPKLEFDANQLLISYDLINKNKADHFYVWVEIENKNGEAIQANNLSGDLGELIKAGANKQIIWVIKKDSIILNEEIFIEVKAEKYKKSFNKGSILLMSSVMPGLGQSRMSEGKPWWLIGVASYGALAGGFISHNSYQKTYESYRFEEDPIMRTDLLSKAQQQLNISTLLIVSGAALWAANMVWVVLAPNNYKPLQHMQLSLNKSTDPYSGTALLTLRVNF